MKIAHSISGRVFVPRSISSATSSGSARPSWTWRSTRQVPTVIGDAGALNQVFLNILKNAAEALEGQGGAIEITVSEEEAQVLVRVRDTGPGMEAAVQERLFEPFFTTKVAGKGTGLGLSMSRRIVERHGGSIEIESEPGEGTCVTVRLPAEGANGA